MPNLYVNKVTVNNATIIDLTNDTAIASDVASGKYFHLATGERVVGTASGGGGNAYTLTTVVPQQMFTAAPAGGGYQAELTHSGVLEEGEPYLITLDDEVYVLECGVLWGSEYIVGTPSALWNSGGSGDATIPFAVDWDTSVMIVAVYDTDPHTIKVERLEFVDGPLDLIAKSVTANGTYDAEDDGVDGYSSVTVNVPTGSSMNVQTAQSTTRVASTTYTKTASLTCAKTGTYDVYWDCFRSSTSGTNGSQLYVGGSAHGDPNTTFASNVHAQTNHLTGVTLAANQEVAVYVRSRASNYYAYCGQLTIVQTA